ncbi:hypothetical protein [Edaphocola flava]|uniref:hypothetical protein n=1 Tax=Edaphocola flava TaxID=2499629 RepID=UPI00100B93F5|nr:hypothetical protein [Edaphocola flava]
MPKKYLSLFASLLLLFSACNKDRNKKSTFYIDGKQYETRKFEAYVMSGNSEMTYSGSEFVSLVFFDAGFSKSGAIPISNSTQPATANIGVILGDGKIYIVSSYTNAVVSATEENGLGKYTIEPIWLRIRVPDPSDSTKAIEGNDSIRFWGTIYEAKDKTIR